MLRMIIWGCLLILVGIGQLARANSFQAANDTMGDPLEEYYWYQDFAVSIGAGAGYTPEYPGASSYTLSALPIVDLNYKRTFFLSSLRGAGAQFSPIENIVVGTRILYDFGRDNEDYIQNMDDLPGSLDGGIFLRLMHAPWVFNIDAQTALTSAGHQGSYGGASIAYEYKYSPEWEFLTRAGASVADDNYMRAYFGVTPSEAINTGFKPYAPSGGFKDADAAFTATYLGFESWRFFSTLAAGWMGSIPAGSDVVQSRMQYRMMLAANYIF